MKINHRRGDLKRQDHKDNYFFRSSLLKQESNRDRRRYDRAALVDALHGEDGMTFAPNHMGNPWGWD